MNHKFINNNIYNTWGIKECDILLEKFNYNNF